MSPLEPRTVTEWLRLSCLCDVESPWSFADLDAVAEAKLGALPVWEPPELRELRRNRVRMGTLRYNRLGFPGFDHCGSALRHIGSYVADANTEHIVDAINLLMLERSRPQFEGARYARTVLFREGSVLDAAWRVRRYQLDPFLELLDEAIAELTHEWRCPTPVDAHFRAIDDGPHALEL